MADLQLERRRRVGLKGWITRCINSIETLLGDAEPNYSQIALEFETLITRKNKLIDCQNTIESLLETDEAIGAEIEAQGAFYDEIQRVKTRVSHYLRHVSTQPSANLQVNTREVQPEVRLPKLELPTFDGDFLQWQSFRERFVSAVHHENRLPTIQKFQHLISCLRGEALQVIAGLSVTAGNYDKAFDLLDDRFDDKTKIISSHVQHLISIEPVTEISLPSLKSLYDNIIRHIRGLESLSVDYRDYGQLLFLLLIKSKFPQEVVLSWSRRHVANDESDSVYGDEALDDLSSFMNFVQREIRVRSSVEAVNELGVKDSSVVASKENKVSKDNSSVRFRHKSGPRSNFPTASFHSADAGKQFIPQLNCVFCSGSHRPLDCTVVSSMTIDARRKKVKEAKRCFLCLKPSRHLAKDCRSGSRCSKCNGRHHDLICNTNTSSTELTPSSAMLSSESRHVLLMTASVIVTGEKASKVCRVLIDGESQRSLYSIHNI